MTSCCALRPRTEVVSLATRQGWTLAWAESRQALFRKLFKPVRATALLAYYDHPAVRAVVVGALPVTTVPAKDLVRPKAARAEVAAAREVAK